MAKNREKLKSILFSIGEKEDKEKLIWLDNKDIKRSLNRIAQSIGEIDKKHSLGHKSLIDLIQESIAEARGEIVEDYGPKIEEIKSSYQTLLDKFSSYEENKKSEKPDRKLEKKFQKQIDEILESIENIRPQMWGGSSRTVYLNGSTISPENMYSDINLIPLGGLSVSAVNNPETLRVDVYLSAGSTINYVYNEVVAGSGTAWTLAHVPTTGTVQLYANGQRLMPGGVDYTISGKNITTLLSWVTGTLLADYQY